MQRVSLSFGLAVVIAMIGGSTVQAKTLPVRTTVEHDKKEAHQTARLAQQRAQQTQLKQLVKKVGTFRTATWACQDTLGIQRTRAGASVWALPKSITYRGWVVEQWQERASSCLKLQQQHGVVIDRLNRGLSGSPMANTGAELERAGRKHGISPYFIAAIAATESSLGDEACSNNRFNAWGLSSCGSGWYVPQFASWGEAYDFMGKFLSSRWSGASSTYDFHGYAACSDCWGRKTATHMQRLFGVGNSVRY